MDLSSIKKPERLNPIYVDDNFKEVDVEDAKFILLSPVEFAKIAALAQMVVTYKEVAMEQETLINLHINTINALKEYLELERAKSLQYREL